LSKKLSNDFTNINSLYIGYNHELIVFYSKTINCIYLFSSHNNIRGGLKSPRIRRSIYLC